MDDGDEGRADMERWQSLRDSGDGVMSEMENGGETGMAEMERCRRWRDGVDSLMAEMEGCRR